MYKPKGITELRTPARLYTPEASTEYGGVEKYTYPEHGQQIFINFKSYGGTENVMNGVLSVLDTATVTTWYRSDIKAKSRIILDSGAVYEIISEPENVEMSGQYCVCKVRRVKGGA